MILILNRYTKNRWNFKGIFLFLSKVIPLFTVKSNCMILLCELLTEGASKNIFNKVRKLYG